MKTCPRCGQENRQAARFCDACGAPLEPEHVPREVRKTVTVVFADVTGSTALGGRLDPEPLRQMMSRYFAEMRAVLEHHGGTVEKFIGDAVMAVFGIPTLHEDDALRAARAAVEMQTALAALNAELERDVGATIATRIGVNTGEVVAGDPAAGQAFASGDAVNVASRLQDAAQPGEVLIGASTHRLVRDSVRVEPVQPLALKGKDEPVTAYRLLEVLPSAAAGPIALASPMVGRETERRRLHAAFEQAVGDRSCQLFTVLGSAGVGKSRLVAEFLHELNGRATVIRGRCLPYGEGITFWPLGEAINAAAGLEEGDSAARARSKVARLLEGDDDAALISNHVADLIGLGDATTGTEQGFWAVRKLFEALARRNPLVVVFDDIQWGEQTFLELVEHIADWSRDAPILLLCMARPELLETRPGWGGGKGNATSVLLEPLNGRECERLIGNLLGESDAAGAVRARVMDAAEGNPLFVEEMLATLIDDGLLRAENGGWTVAGALSEVAVPPTIHALLAARVDRLSEGERIVAERASVEGRVFHRGAVTELTPETLRGGVQTHLSGLVRKELVRPDRATFTGDEAFRFRHLLIRDAAYESMPKQTRADLHERFADWLERQAGERAAEYEEIIGYHLEQAYRYRLELGPADTETARLAALACTRLTSAGLRARARGDMPAAVSLLSRATELAVQADERRELLGWLADALFDAGDYARAETVLEEAIEQANVAGDQRLELRGRLTRLALVKATSTSPDFGVMTEAAERAVPVFEAQGDWEALAKAWILLGEGHWAACRYGARAKALEQALIHARRASDKRLEAEILQGLGLSLYGGPTPAAEGLRRCEELLALASGDRVVEAGILGPLGGFYAHVERFGDARERFRTSHATLVDLGLKFHAALAGIFGGRIELLAGDAAAAEETLRWSCETLRSMGETNVFSTAAGHLSAAIYEQGRYDEADDVAENAKQTTAADDVLSGVLWRGTTAKVRAQQGRVAEGQTLAREAVELATQTDSLNMRAGALIDLAETLRFTGRVDDCPRLLAKALALYEQKGNVAAARRTQGLLVTL